MHLPNTYSSQDRKTDDSTLAGRGRRDTSRRFLFVHPPVQVEVWLPVTKLSTSHEPAELTKILRKGQDLACFRCQRDLQWRPHEDEVIPCDSCGLIQSRSHYDNENLKIWQSLSDDDIYCLSCLGRSSRKAKVYVIRCYGECHKELPEHHFDPAQVTQWRESKQLLEAKCLRCTARDKVAAGGGGTPVFPCFRCKTKKSIVDFAPLAVKDWLQNERRNISKWRCYECQ